MAGDRWLIVNRLSGAGRWQQRLIELATRQGLGVRVLSFGQDAGDVARTLASDGAAVLGAAGGDGTIRSVAQVAVDHDLPFVCVPSGTRNHFADDMGIDDRRPLTSIAAFDGVERRVDVGDVNGKIFLNNVSIGAYARMVHDPGYRHRRMRVTYFYARRALGAGKHQVQLDVDMPAHIRAPATTIAILVANNEYAPLNAPGQALRPRVDQGELWVYVLAPPERRSSVVAYGIRSATSAARGRFVGAVWPAKELVIGSSEPGVPIPMAVDGEGKQLHIPLRFCSRPGALRLLVPHESSSVARTVTLRW